jgi:hypothetical protein
MSDLVKVALIVAVAPTIAAVGSFFLGWINRSKLTVVEQKLDGRLTELLELTRKASHAEGEKAEFDKHPNK